MRRYNSIVIPFVLAIGIRGLWIEEQTGPGGEAIAVTPPNSTTVPTPSRQQKLELLQAHLDLKGVVSCV